MSTVLHASSASVSAIPFSNDIVSGMPSALNNTGSAIPALSQTQSRRQRYSSRSNSISGASVTTVQHAGSRSSSRQPAGRSQSPSENALHALRFGNGQHSRRRSVAIDPSDRSSNGGLMENLNRWSQSTDSSLSSARRHHRASSGVLLTSQTLSPSRRPSQDQYKQVFAKARQRPASPIEPPRERPWISASRPSSRDNGLSALHTSGLVSADRELDSPSTASTGVLANGDVFSDGSSFGEAYFASISTSPRGTATRLQRPQTARSTTTPAASLNYSRMPRAEDVKESAHIRRQSEHLGGMENRLRQTTLAAAQDRLLPTPLPTVEPQQQKSSASRPKDKAEREKKVMLSKALEKANTAVVLDNKQNFVGALDAYTDACTLLQQVMDRSVHVADKRKLDAIRLTYTTRIEELRLLEETRTTVYGEKGLPSIPLRPTSKDSTFNSREDSMSLDGALQDASQIGTAIASGVPRLSYPLNEDRDSFFSKTMADVEKAGRFQDHRVASQSPLDTARLHIVNQRVSKLPAPEETRYLPAPLTMRKTPSPTVAEFKRDSYEQTGTGFHTPTEAPSGEEQWKLSTTEEKHRSRPSSVHSVSSQTGVHRKPIHDHRDMSNADLDAAFDAAVEAAYDEGLEPDYGSKAALPVLTTIPAKTAIIPSPEVKEIISPTADTFGATVPFVRNEHDNDEEERILDGFTQDYGHGFNFAFGTKSALPRQSDSSGYSRSTWQSSQASERLTAGTSLSTVAENDSFYRSSAKPPLPNISPVSPVNLDNLPPSLPPPSTSLPAPPAPNQLSGSTVRSRRLSGQNARELKIETSGELPAGRKRASTLHNFRLDADNDTDTHKEVMMLGAPLEPSPSDAAHEHMLKSPPSLDILSTFATSSDRPSSNRLPADDPQRSDDPYGNTFMLRPTMLRKNQSSLSLRADHTVLLPSPGLHEMAIPTPLSATFTIPRSRPADALTSQRAQLSNTFTSPTSVPVGHGTKAGNYLFDTSLSDRDLPTSPMVSPGEAPQGLEPCPESTLLRPFWLMRCIATTINHQRGGFITTKLFIPREIWQTRGVKLKGVEDKIANCDLLTAALGQLSQVDTYDADLVMNELQRFEEVMERVQVALVKKLGGEVGVHGITAVFRDAAPFSSTSVAGSSEKGSDTLSGTTDKNSKSHSSKGYLSSWRKLRNKSSGPPVGHAGSFQSNKGSDKPDIHTMASVPMTSFVPVERRGQKRDARNLTFDGPNREYVGSLARLFQGVQVLDQIARQVEDPGLKHSSPTHVGLELSIRHAAEFFSFYICRFVLADLTILLDKYIKRGTEWVMA